MKIYRKFVGLVVSAVLFGAPCLVVQAQEGDQILDGIGETDMVARYILSGDLKDWSRNSLHARLSVGAPQFVEDPQFGKVLSLGGKKDVFVQFPQETLTGLESVSVSGWVNLRSDKPGQVLFDFGVDATRHFMAGLVGAVSQPIFQALLTDGNATDKAVQAPALSTGKWLHWSVVVDIPARVMTTYINGKPVGESKKIPKELSAVFGVGSGQENQLLLGKLIGESDSRLDALLHDVRIYRVPLSRRQVAGIYYAKVRTGEASTVNVRKNEDELQKFPLTREQLYNAYLLRVDDIEVETNLGDLPRLPSYVNGVYKDNMQGPKVRVLWPAPTDNAEVLEDGRYVVVGRIPGTDLAPKARVRVVGGKASKTPSLALEAFDLSQVSLDPDRTDRGTKFIENRDKFVQTLAQTDINSFLYMFRHAFGQPQPAGAKPLGVWDSQETKLRGHATGHYLTAIAQAYASTGYDPALKANFEQKMAEIVDVLYTLSQLSGSPAPSVAEFIADPTLVPMGKGKQAYDSDLSDDGIRQDYWNWGKGFISAYPPDQFIMLEQGASYGGQKTQVWAPYYTLHKIMAGLIDIYEVSGNKKALDIAMGMGDWVYARLSQLPQETLVKMWSTYIAGEFGGMNESMAHLYRITGNENYMKTALLFDNINMFFGDQERSHGLAKNVDTFRGLHANQHIPQIVGSIEMYTASNTEDYFKIADNFWYKAVNDYMYSIGGVAGARNPANAECFAAQPASLYENGFSTGGQNETCATYNMLKLTSNLFMYDQRTELMDYYERGLYNHILASVAEDSPANTYHVPLNPGAMKQFGNPNMTGFTCCNGTAIESSTKLQNSIYFKSKDNKALYVNLFIPSTLDWKERNVVIEQNTNFPKEDNTSLTVKGKGRFDIHVRVPGWASQGFAVKINGKIQKTEATPGTYLKLSRQWKEGDVIDIQMPFQFHLDPVMDQQNLASLFYGPILLAAQEPEARKEWRKVTFDASDIGKSIQGNPSTLEFTIDGVEYKPFYDTYGRHSVYLDVTLQ